MSTTKRLFKSAIDTCAFLAGLIEIFLFSKEYIAPAIKKKKSPGAEEATSGQSQD